jgi:hypothetical protein
VPAWNGIGYINKRTALDARAEEFRKEWNSTLQIIRDLGAKVSLDVNRPAWVKPDVLMGAQADQFLHAQYYENTFDGNRAKFEEHLERNKRNPDSATQKALQWWHNLEAATSSESITLDEWAPLLHKMLARGRIQTLTEDDLVQVFQHVHAIRDHSRRVANKILVSVQEVFESFESLS